MKKSYKHFSILIFFIFSCQRSELDYASFSEEIHNAWLSHDQQKMLAVAEQINERYINSTDGARFLKLKLTVLTFAGKYLDAFNEIDINNHFADNYEFIVAKGILAERIGIDSYQYFNSAFELLKKKPQNAISDGEKVLEIYLAIILEKKDIVDNDIYLSLPPDGKDIVDYYMRIGFMELLTASPIGFLQEPLPRNTNSKKVWWE